MKKAMTSSTKIIPEKTLVIYPCTRGFSYAVMLSPLEVVEVNLVSPKQYNSDKLFRVFLNIYELHQPLTLIFENNNSKYSRKGKRSKNLQNRISKWAKKKDITLKTYSRNDIRQIFDRWFAKTKFDIAQVLLKNIPMLVSYSYPPRKYPQRDHNYESIFSAVSLGVTHYFKSH